jgi:hypothetical protein
MSRIFTLFLLLIGLNSSAQHLISGKITDEKGKPVNGASISLENTLDGGTTDSTGAFHFETTEAGNQVIVATAVGYSKAGKPVTITGNISDINLVLKNTAQSLEEVTITAGAFEASNDKDKTVLKPLDIVTTAGTQADVVRAIETLPGTQKQGTENGMFVRGGDASEAAYIVDGLVVQNAFFSGAPGVATRSRFGAFQYKGVSFSSGGYSARYGQALSSVLEMNSLDLPERSTVNLGLHMAGVYASASKLWKTSGGDVSANYTNLAPFYGVVKTNVNFYDVPKGYGGSARYAFQPNKTGIVKFMVSGSRFTSGTEVPDSAGRPVRYGLENENYNGSISYRQSINNKFTLYTAASYSYNIDNFKYDAIPGMREEQRSQLRVEGKYHFTNRLSLLLGGDIQNYSVDNGFSTSKRGFKETLPAGYLEMEWTPVYWLAVKPGARYEHSELLQQDAIAPRFALAVKAGKHGQVSFASGIFYQNPDYLYLYKIDSFAQPLDYQKAVHYIVNYQWQKQDRTLRLEGYYKDYGSLIRERGNVYYIQDVNRPLGKLDSIDNSGHGYAQGAELFWRDKKTFKNTDYWISYSYIDTRRLYKNYFQEATPEFISDHNLSVVGKYWIDKIQTQINATYSYASGRPSYRPTDFARYDVPEYHNLSFTVNHLRSIGRWFTVIYAGVDNATNQKNVFGYRYSADGNTTQPIRPALYRSFFVGANFSLTKFEKDEL